MRHVLQSLRLFVLSVLVWNPFAYAEDLQYIVLREARAQAPHRREYLYLSASKIPTRGEVTLFCHQGETQEEQSTCISLFGFPSQGASPDDQLFVFDFGPQGGIQKLHVYTGEAIVPLAVTREKLRERIDEELAQVNSLEKFLDSIVVTRSVQENPEFIQTLQALNTKQGELSAKESEYERKKVSAELLQSLSSDIRVLEARDSRLAQRGRALEEYLRKLVQSAPTRSQEAEDGDSESTQEMIAILERPGPRIDRAGLRAELIRLRKQRQSQELQRVLPKTDSYIDSPG